MGSRDARDGLDQVVDAFLQVMPQEHRDELRGPIRPDALHDALDGSPDPIPDDGDTDQHSDHPHSSPARLPAIPFAHALQLADQLIDAATRGASVPAPRPHTPSLPSPSDTKLPSKRPGGPGRQPVGHAVRLSNVTPERIQWLWPGRLAAGKLTLLDGDPGLGKSTLLCEVAARITRGHALPGGQFSEPRGVLLLSAEDDLLDTIRPRLDAAGGDPERVVSLRAIPDRTSTGRPVSLPGDLPILEVVIRRIDAALVVIDPLLAYLRPGGRGSRGQDERQSLAALTALAERTGVAIVAVRHLTKSSQTNPLYRGQGGIGIIGAARCALLLAADPDDPDRRILAVSKGNLARSPASFAFRLDEVPGTDVARVVWEGERPWTATDLLRQQSAERGHRSPTAGDVARAWLRETLASGPRPAVELQREAAERGIGRTTLFAARRAVGVTAHKERTANGQWLWALEPNDAEALALDSSSQVRTL